MILPDYEIRKRNLIEPFEEEQLQAGTYDLRLEKAVELFEQGNSSIMEASLSVGFNNLSYFHRAFKKKYRMTPLSFINELNKYEWYI